MKDSADRVSLRMRSADGTAEVRVVGRPSTSLLPASIFADVAAASAFFEPGSVGFSATAAGDRLDEVVLTTFGWEVAPLAIDEVASSWFDDPSRFPPGAAVFDCALIMREIAHEWRAGASGPL